MSTPAPPRTLLCFNAGSSSLKFALFRSDGAEQTALAEGGVERADDGTVHLHLRGCGVELERQVAAAGLPSFVRLIWEALAQQGMPPPTGVGHRFVHGGPRHYEPERLTPELMLDLRACIPFAPLHLPGSLEVVEAVTQTFPTVPQVLCFDTAFHRCLPPVARRLPLPAKLDAEGLHRYGFHGLSYESIVGTLRLDIVERAVVAHLGNGASLVALRCGQSVDTTMGFGPTGGVMMGTRTGDLDPSVMLYLLRQKQYGVAELEGMVNRASGLLGVSGGLSADMRTLLEHRSRDANAALAVEMFCYQVRKAVGSLAAALGGLDALVFTGGIGEKSAEVRALVCQGLAHLGVELDAQRNIQALNAQAPEVVSRPDSRCRVQVARTNENLVIARHTAKVLEETS